VPLIKRNLSPDNPTARKSPSFNPRHGAGKRVLKGRNKASLTKKSRIQMFVDKRKGKNEKINDFSNAGCGLSDGFEGFRAGEAL
jgi:hypothetical protein